MTVCKRRDTVLVGFVFADESVRTLRPAVVISSSVYNHARREVIVAAITSNVRRQLVGEYLIADWKGAGLLFPSVVTGILRTITRTMVERKLGTMARPEMAAVDRELRRALDL